MLKKLTLKRKTGFANIGSSIVIINDYRGFEFYNTSTLKKPVKYFNLPKGVYYVKAGSIYQLDRPIKYGLRPLPPFERQYPLRNLTIKFGKNPNKATIFHRTGVILFDNSFKDVPLYVVWFIYWHEIGHFYYTIESKADEFSRQMMLKKGYNPSQIAKASLLGLSHHQYTRKALTLRAGMPRNKRNRIKIKRK